MSNEISTTQNENTQNYKLSVFDLILWGNYGQILEEKEPANGEFKTTYALKCPPETTLKYKDGICVTLKEPAIVYIDQKANDIRVEQPPKQIIISDMNKHWTHGGNNIDICEIQKFNGILTKNVSEKHLKKLNQSLIAQFASDNQFEKKEIFNSVILTIRKNVQTIIAGDPNNSAVADLRTVIANYIIEQSLLTPLRMCLYYWPAFRKQFWNLSPQAQQKLIESPPPKILQACIEEMTSRRHNYD